MQARQKPVNRTAPLVPVRWKSAGALLHSDGQREVCDRCAQRFAQRRRGTRAQPAIRPLSTSARRWCRWPGATSPMARPGSRCALRGFRGQRAARPHRARHGPSTGLIPEPAWP